MTAIGHEDATRAWREALTGERMHHAWLLTGPVGIGKGKFAQRAAKELVASGAAPGGRFEGANHPDILTIERPPKDDKEAKKRDDGSPYLRKRNIAVDQVRRLQQRLTTRPSLGTKRAVIIEPADAMETSSANALLKSLEEPPVGTHFLLIAHQAHRLLPTIRSRCRVLPFRPVSQAQLAEWLSRERSDCPEQVRTAAVEAAGGSPGKALAFLDEGLGAVDLALGALLDQDDPELMARGALVNAIGQRPAPEKLRAAIGLAQSRIGAAIASASRDHLERLHHAYQELSRLEGEVTRFNYDPGLLIAHIGTLLAETRVSKARSHG